MARVLVSAFSNVTWTQKRYHDSFMEGFIRALERAGNEVLSFHMNGIVKEQFDNELRDNINEGYIKKLITDFKPEMIISANNLLPDKKVLQYTDCPILLYSADAPSLYADKKLIKDNLERYYFLNGADMVTSAINELYAPSDNHMLFFGYATDMRTLDIPQTEDITYVGSMPHHSEAFVQFFFNLDAKESSADKKNQIKAKFFEALQKYRDDNCSSSFDFDFSPYLKSSMSNFAEFAATCLLSCRNKFSILSQLTDLKLKVHGFPYSWPLAMVYNYELLRCFDYNLSVSLDQNMATYNKSKLSLNMPNSVAENGLSWRVPEIMATNSVLLSHKSKLLKQWIEGYADLPMYESPAEAHELAVKLLKDDAWRKDLSLACRKVIDDKCRFESRFKMMQEMTGVSLLKDDPAITGSWQEFCLENALKKKSRFKKLNIFKKSKKR